MQNLFLSEAFHVHNLLCNSGMYLLNDRTAHSYAPEQIDRGDSVYARGLVEQVDRGEPPHPGD